MIVGKHSLGASRGLMTREDGHGAPALTARQCVCLRGQHLGCCASGPLLFYLLSTEPENNVLEDRQSWVCIFSNLGKPSLKN